MKEISKRNTLPALSNQIADLSPGRANPIYYDESWRLSDGYKKNRVACVNWIKDKLGKIIALSELDFTAPKIEFVAENIGKDFPRLRSNEFMYLLYQGIKGNYGETYGKFTIDMILGKNGWVRQYYDERSHWKRLNGNAKDEEHLGHNDLMEQMAKNYEQLKRNKQK